MVDVRGQGEVSSRASVVSFPLPHRLARPSQPTRTAILSATTRADTASSLSYEPVFLLAGVVEPTVGRSGSIPVVASPGPLPVRAPSHLGTALAVAPHPIHHTTSITTSHLVIAQPHQRVLVSRPVELSLDASSTSLAPLSDDRPRGRDRVWQLDQTLYGGRHATVEYEGT